MEEWKDIKGYEGLYQISNKGRVKSLYNKGKILTPGKDKDGYSIVSLYKNKIKKTNKVHRLVAQAFLSNPDNLPQVNHKDENKLNNCVENLEWCSVEYNINYGTRNERTRKKLTCNKKIICIETGEIFNTTKDIIDKMFPNKPQCTIINHLKGRSKSVYKYHFKYIEE